MAAIAQCLGENKQQTNNAAMCRIALVIVDGRDLMLFHERHQRVEETPEYPALCTEGRTVHFFGYVLGR
jgi:hypothetical protein